jgi:hypothetical protein
VGVGNASSVGTFLSELSVEDRPRLPGLLDGDDRFDAVDPSLTSGDPGAAKFIEDMARAELDGDGSGDGKPLPSSPVAGV